MTEKGKKVTFVALKQSHVEAYLNELPIDVSNMRIPVYNRVSLRAAILAGWFDPPLDVDPEKLGELEPGKIRKLGEAVQTEYARVMEISPE